MLVQVMASVWTWVLLAVGLGLCVVSIKIKREALIEKYPGQWTDFLLAIPNDYEIYSGPLSVVDVQASRDELLRFSDAPRPALVLEMAVDDLPAPAIRVVGVTSAARYCFGRVPGAVAEQVIGSGLADLVEARLQRVYVADAGFIDITFQLVGPRVKKAQYEEFCKAHATR